VFERRNILVVAGSIDTIDLAQQTRDKHEITFPLAYGMNVLEFARATGAHYHAERGYLHATGFILKPDGTIQNAVYSTGPIGRLSPAECIALIAYYSKAKKQPA
jgi:peroxiredoxin